MNGLAQLVERLVHLSLRFIHRLLSGIDRVSEQIAAVLNARGVAAVIQLDTLGFQKAAEICEEFVFLDRFHNSKSKVAKE